MFCKNCGKEIQESFKHCPFCGDEVSSAEKPAVNTVPQQTAPQQPQEEVSNLGGMKVLGFFLGLFGPCTLITPIVSLVLYLVWRDDKPKTASAIGRFTIIGLIVGFVILIAVAAIFAVLFAVHATHSIFSFFSDIVFDIV
ncbi:MAG: zinc ribbon domain-containing protein [Clostridia bacterium]|nr:zinc ribbon domain-containing protein [Clostridia bacterium]